MTGVPYSAATLGKAVQTVCGVRIEKCPYLHCDRVTTIYRRVCHSSILCGFNLVSSFRLSPSLVQIGHATICMSEGETFVRAREIAWKSMLDSTLDCIS